MRERRPTSLGSTWGKLHELNRRYGHAGGDRYIGALADILKSYPPTDPEGRLPKVSEFLTSNIVAGRWGGDEFLIFATADNRKALETLTKELRSKIAAVSLDFEDKATGKTESIQLAASLGTSHLEPDKPWADLIEEANAESDREKKELGLNRDAEDTSGSS